MMLTPSTSRRPSIPRSARSSNRTQRLSREAPRPAVQARRGRGSRDGCGIRPVGVQGVNALVGAQARQHEGADGEQDGHAPGEHEGRGDADRLAHGPSEGHRDRHERERHEDHGELPHLDGAGQRKRGRRCEGDAAGRLAREKDASLRDAIGCNAAEQHGEHEANAVAEGDEGELRRPSAELDDLPPGRDDPSPGAEQRGARATASSRYCPLPNGRNARGSRVLISATGTPSSAGALALRECYPSLREDRGDGVRIRGATSNAGGRR